MDMEWLPGQHHWHGQGIRVRGVLGLIPGEYPFFSGPISNEIGKKSFIGLNVANTNKSMGPDSQINQYCQPFTTIIGKS